MIWPGGRLRRWAVAVCVVYASAVAVETAAALEPPSGSRNFIAPNHVPNYFSNETAPFRGTSGGQTASPGGPVVAVPGTLNHGSVAANRSARQKSVHAGRHRARLARGKASRHGHVARARATRGGKVISTRSASVRSKASTAAGRAAPAKIQRGKAHGKAQKIARARG